MSAEPLSLTALTSVVKKGPDHVPVSKIIQVVRSMPENHLYVDCCVIQVKFYYSSISSFGGADVEIPNSEIKFHGTFLSPRRQDDTAVSCGGGVTFFN